MFKLSQKVPSRVCTVFGFMELFILSTLPLSDVPADDSPRLKDLIRESISTGCLLRTDFHKHNPLVDSDIPEAARYIESNKDNTSYYLLYVLSKHYPKEYTRLSGATKAAVLCSALQHAKC